MNLNDSTEGRWMTPDLLGGDITNPQSLNRYAYVLNNPTTNVDPSGLGSCNVDNGSYEGSGTPFGPCEDTNPADPCSYSASNDASCAQPPGLWPNGQPIYPPDVGGGPSSGGVGPSSGTTTAPSSPVGNHPPLSGDYGPLTPLSPWQIWGPGGSTLPCDFGTCGVGMPGNGFAAAAALYWGAEGLGGLVCFGSGACEVALTVAGGAAAGYGVYRGIKAGVRIYQNRAEQERIRAAAREVGVDPRELGDAIEVYKQDHGMPNSETLDYATILGIAQQVKQGLYKGLK